MFVSSLCVGSSSYDNTTVVCGEVEAQFLMLSGEHGCSKQMDVLLHEMRLLMEARLLTEVRFSMEVRDSFSRSSPLVIR